MKKWILTLALLVLTSGCGGNGFGSNPSLTPPTDGGGGDDSNPPLTVIIPKPTYKCGSADCFSVPLSSINNGVGEGELWSLVPEAHNNYKIMLGLLNLSMDEIDPLLRSAGVSSCEDIGNDEIIVGEGMYDLQLRDPTISFSMGGPLIPMEKRMTLLRNGSPEVDVEINCGGATTVKTLQVIWPQGSEIYHYLYQIDSANGAIYLVGGSTDPTMNTLFGFKNDGGKDFSFISLVKFWGDDAQFLLAAKTDPTDPKNLEYVAYHHFNPPSDESLDLTPYGAAADIERICAVDYDTPTPTFSDNPSDCHTLSMEAKASDWMVSVGMNSGAIWTTEYLDALYLPDADYN